MIRGPVLAIAVVGASFGLSAAAQDVNPAQDGPAQPDVAASAASAPSTLGQAKGMLLLDYQVIRVPQEPSIDLLGFHVLGEVTDWLYLGAGAYAPLFKGEYGGFMAFGITAHAQRKLWGDLFANAGLSIGGGGGGKSQAHSTVLAGTGGFAKGYVGLGYDFADFSVGANVSRMTFNHSAIDNTQLNVFVQVPFTYLMSSYASAGQRLGTEDARRALDASSENTLTLGLDNLAQIDPQGSNKSTIRLADLQFAHYLTTNTYWYASLGVGYGGLRLYNQAIGGLGHRFTVSPRIRIHGQLGAGSGGWSPDRIDTGAGLLVYPKLSAEYSITDNWSLSLSAGYLFAPTGSSKNYTYGASVSYRIQSGRDDAGASQTDGAVYRGLRLSLFQQTEFNVRVRGLDEAHIKLLSGQLDTVVGDHVYIPVQAAVAYNAYQGHPGYGELVAGIGVQTRYDKGDRFQFFGQLLAGTNAHGAILKPGIGMNVSLNERLAIHVSAGTTRALTAKEINFKADYAGLGLTYRFAVPSW